MLRRCIQFIAGLLLLSLISGCDRQLQPDRVVAERVVVLGDLQLKISPGHIPVETLLTMQLHSQQPLTQVSGELTGVSMYMGRIPLRFSRDAGTGVWQTNFMLGACSDPKMTWRLTLHLTNSQGQSEQRVTEFQSSWRE